jgi:hypothetical protein
MLEKLLRRLTGRHANAAPAHSAFDSRLISSTNSSTHGISDSELRPFPARSPSASRPTSRDNALNWDRACKAHFEACVDPTNPPQLPAIFADYGGAHAAVAQALWAEHKNIYQQLVHISSPDGLVAILHPAQQRVWVRADAPYYEPHTLTWQEVPANTPPPNSPQFHSTTVQHLLWFYGQAVPLAPQALPVEMESAPLQLRRFPPVEPQTLEMRHLALLRLLSAGALTFDQLVARTSADDQHFLCADLASLYFTGSLVLLTSKACA